MRRIAMPISAAVTAASVTAAAFAGCSSTVTMSVTDQTNTLTFSGQNDTVSLPVAYAFSGDYSVTSDQPWGGVVGCPSPADSCVITVTAGRYKSTPVAQWFTQNAPVAMCTSQCGGGQPDQLNFAFTGTVTINGSTYPITLGQGSPSQGMNNWWFGGAGWTRLTVDAHQVLATPDGKYYLDDGGGSDSEIQVAPASS